MPLNLLNQPPDLKPQPEMGRNEPCWCGSGRKWKKCHYEREAQAKVNPHELATAFRKARSQGTCLHPEAANATCDRKAIQSHTIQKNRGLRAIAEDGHVLSFKLGLEDLIRTQGKFEPKRLGIRQASTFPGFCNKHDTDVFAPVEVGTLSLDREAAFLLSYRATCYEVFAKLLQQEGIRAMRESDRGRPFHIQAAIQTQTHWFAYGSGLGLKDVQAFKARFDAIILGEDDAQFHYLAYELDEPLPIVVACAFYPEFDFAHHRLQLLGRMDPALEDIAINITSRDGKGIVTFGWFEYGNGAARRFAESFDALSALDKGNAIVRMAFDYSENVFFRQSWWEGLNDDHRRALLAHVRSGADPHKEKVGDLRSDGRQYASLRIANMVTE